MVNVGKKRGLNEEFTGGRRAKHQHTAVKRPSLQPQSPHFNEIDGGDFIALSEKRLVAREGSPFERLLIESQHGLVVHRSR